MVAPKSEVIRPSRRKCTSLRTQIVPIVTLLGRALSNLICTGSPQTMSVNACKRPLRPHSRNLKFVGASDTAPTNQIGQNVVLTSNASLSSPGSTCNNPFALGGPRLGQIGGKYHHRRRPHCRQDQRATFNVAQRARYCTRGRRSTQSCKPDKPMGSVVLITGRITTGEQGGYLSPRNGGDVPHVNLSTPQLFLYSHRSP